MITKNEAKEGDYLLIKCGNENREKKKIDKKHRLKRGIYAIALIDEYKVSFEVIINLYNNPITDEKMLKSKGMGLQNRGLSKLYPEGKKILKNILDKRRKQDIKNLTFDELKKEIDFSNKKPKIKLVTQKIYSRNPYLIEYIKRKAKGICQDCKKNAPFKSKKTGEQYLEAHHIIPLSEKGEDGIENMIALCPNCHRKRHYG